MTDSWEGGKNMARRDRFEASQKKFKTNPKKMKKREERGFRERPVEDNSGACSFGKKERKELAIQIVEQAEKQAEEQEDFPSSLYFPEEEDYPKPNIPEDALRPKFIFAINNVVDYSLEMIKMISSDRLITLNFASAKNPGGGIHKMSGSIAQEEAIVYAAPNLYGALRFGNGKEMYSKNIKDPKRCLYHNEVILTPKITFLQDGKNSVDMAIVTVPAVNYKEFKLRNKKNPDWEEIATNAMKDRVDKMLAVVSSQGYTHLIMGPWGCGIFGGKISTLMRLVKESSYLNAFTEIHFISLSESEVKEMKKEF